MMNDFNHITGQLNKTRFQPRTGRWTTLPELQLVDDFTDADVVPDQPQTSNMSFSTIIQQVDKKKLS